MMGNKLGVMLVYIVVGYGYFEVFLDILEKDLSGVNVLVFMKEIFFLLCCEE